MNSRLVAVVVFVVGLVLGFSPAEPVEALTPTPSPTLTPTPTRVSTRTPTPTPDPRVRRVNVFGTKTSPRIIRITRNQAVAWRNGDRLDHEIIAGGAIDANGRRVKLTFTRELPARDTPGDAFVSAPLELPGPGKYGYLCSIHRKMGGTIVVR